ncbi:hypothetical protein BGX38DRAFT_605589 [Terfezia claveryi]|nr:hypothetical protein BGX38DRAFT_605589 [Terfezia claveryi]
MAVVVNLQVCVLMGKPPFITAQVVRTTPTHAQQQTYAHLHTHAPHTGITHTHTHTHTYAYLPGSFDVLNLKGGQLPCSARHPPAAASPLPFASPCTVTIRDVVDTSEAAQFLLEMLFSIFFLFFLFFLFSFFLFIFFPRLRGTVAGLQWALEIKEIQTTFARSVPRPPLFTPAFQAKEETREIRGPLPPHSNSPLLRTLTAPPRSPWRMHTSPPAPAGASAAAGTIRARAPPECWNTLATTRQSRPRPTRCIRRAQHLRRSQTCQGEPPPVVVVHCCYWHAMPMAPLWVRCGVLWCAMLWFAVLCCAVLCCAGAVWKFIRRTLHCISPPPLSSA